MSDADRRQARQRTLTIGACAAAFAFGGPLVAQRFGDQKAQEVYLNEAAVLAESIQANAYATEMAVPAGVFSNHADPVLIPASALFDGDAPVHTDLTGGLTLRARDSAALNGLVSFTLEDLGRFKGGDKQLDCLAKAVYYEARSEDTVGQMAVAEVVMNRVRDPRFPKTFCEVVYQGQHRNTGCQFTFTCDGSVRHKPYGVAWDRARDIALHVLLGLNTPVTNKATHYHTDYVNPYWAPGLVETAAIGTHIFYRFPKTTKEWTVARIALDARRARDHFEFTAESDTGQITEVSHPAPSPTDVTGKLVIVSLEADERPVAPVLAAKAVASRPLEGQPL